MKPLRDAVREFERVYIARAILACGGVRQEAAKLLGISRKTLWEKMKEPKEDNQERID